MIASLKSQSMNAKEMIMKRSTIAKTFAIGAVAALALGIAPAAKADNKGCSNATLKGTFVHTASGLPPPHGRPARRYGYGYLRRKWRRYDGCNPKHKWQH